MPKVVSYTPPWLTRPSPVGALFASAPSKIAASALEDGPGKSAYEGPRRTLAKRGNEVFVVVDNKIRWCSLTRLKDEWEQRSKSKSKKASEGKTKAEDSDEKRAHYRVGCYKEDTIL